MALHSYKIVFMLLSLLLCTSACTADDEGTPAGGSNPPPERLSYLALGDSYTIGEAVAANDRFPEQLQARLQTLGHNVGEPKIIARTGWRTDNLLAAIAADGSLLTDYDLVSVLIGVNDQFQGRSLTSFSTELAKVLDRAEDLAGGPEDVIVLSIPDYSVTPFAAGLDTTRIRQQLEAYNGIVRDSAATRGYGYVDITPISREARRERTLLADDGLHPSAKMYERWVNEMLDEVIAIITE